MDGEIAVGKSTLIKRLVAELQKRGYVVREIKEPIADWERVGIFKKFCEDMSRYAYTFQTFAFATRCKAINFAHFERKDLKEEDRPTVYVMERSPCSDSNVFVESLREQGHFEDYEYQMYQEWTNQWFRVVPRAMWPTCIIYLKTPLDEAYSRIAQRNRDGEKAYDKEYNANLRRHYEKMFTKNERGLVEMRGDQDYPILQVPLKVIDQARDFRIESNTSCQEIEELLQFIESSHALVD